MNFSHLEVIGKKLPDCSIVFVETRLWLCVGLKAVESLMPFVKL